MGGIGKSCLASDLYQRDQETRDFFTDGKSWQKIGQNLDDARLFSLMRSIILDIKLDKSQEEEAQKCLEDSDIGTLSSHLNRLLQDKRCLIVLDDVWNSKHVLHFSNHLGKRCRLLVTTRDHRIAQELGARGVELGLLHQQEASKILITCAGREEPEFPEILEKLNGLTLAIVIVGRSLRSAQTAKEWLKNYNEHTSSIESETSSPKDPNESLEISIELSLNKIFERNYEEKKLYYSLGAFYENSSIPKKIVFELCKKIKNTLITWNDFTNYITKLSAHELLKLDTRKEFITIHNLFYDHNFKNLNKTPGNFYLETQNNLLSTYNPNKADWYTVPYDKYLYMHLAYHLTEAGRQDELRALLFDFKWLEAKINKDKVNKDKVNKDKEAKINKIGDITALIADYDIAMTEKEKNNRYSELNLVKSALQLSAHIIVRQKDQLWEQLYGRLKFLPRKLANIHGLLNISVDRVWLRPLEPSLFTPASYLLQTLKGDSGSISSIAINDKFIISGSDDGALQVWNRSNGNLTRSILTAHDYGVTSVATSSDGKYVISSSYDCTWKKWNLERDGKLIEAKTISSNQGSIFSVALSLDGTKAVTGGQDGTLKVWDFTTGDEIKTLYGHEGGIATVAISRDGNTVVSGSYDETIKIWDLATEEVINTLTEHQDAVLSVFLYEGKDKKIIVSGSADCSLKVWDLEQVQNGETNQSIQTLNQEIYGWVSSVYVNHDGKFVIFGSYDSTLRKWDFQTEQPTRLFHGHGRQITSVIIAPDNSIAISGSLDNTLKVWDLNIEREPPENLRTSRRLLSVKTSEDNSKILCGANNGMLEIYNAKSLELIKELDKQNLIARSVDISRDGILGVAGLNDNSVRVWNLETGKLLHKFEGHTARVMTVALSSNSEIIVSGSEDSTIRVWDLKTGKEKLWDLKTGKENLTPFQRTDAHVHSVILSSDAKILYAGLRDATIKAWNLKSRQELYTIEENELKAPVHTITLSPDGKTLFSGSADKTIKAWNLETRKQLEFEGLHEDELWSIKVSQDGKLLLSTSEDCSIRVWNLKTKKNIATFYLENTVFDSATIVNNSKLVVCCASISKPLFFELENYSCDD